MAHNKSKVASRIVWAVNCGGDAHTDINGIRYQKDFLTTGIASGMKVPIKNVEPQDQVLYQTLRYSRERIFSYDVPIYNDDEYVLVLKFVENSVYSPNQRVFDVKLNGRHTVIHSLDILATVGMGAAYVVEVPFKVHDGKLKVNGETSDMSQGSVPIQFVKAIENPAICAMHVRRASSDNSRSSENDGGWSGNNQGRGRGVWRGVNDDRRSEGPQRGWRNGQSEGSQRSFGNSQSEGSQRGWGNSQSEGSQRSFGNGQSEGSQRGWGNSQSEGSQRGWGNRERSDEGRNQGGGRGWGQDDGRNRDRGRDSDRGRDGNRFSDGSKLSITVPSDMVGKIIGRGGQKIRELQEESGTNIRINKDSGGYGETEIDIAGPEDKLEKAKEMIQELVRPVDHMTRTFQTRPANFPVVGDAREMPTVPVGPPINEYEPQEQSDNICMSVREAQLNREPVPIDPQIQEDYLQQIENRIHHITISTSQLNPQQALNRNTRELSQLINTRNLGQVTASPQMNPVLAVAPPPASVTDQDAMSSVLPEYTMDKRPRGWCVIINNKVFTVQAGDRDAEEMQPRIGTDRDAESLQKVFSDLNFAVHRRDDMSDTAMMQYLVEVSHNEKHEMFDCLVVCILAHGVENHLYGSNGKRVAVKDITSTFQANRCPGLAGKPKLFFLQACQGRNNMQGNEVRSPDVIERDAVPVGDLEFEMIPNEADFLIGYATVPGYVSFRSRNSGSWYIRKLCELLEKYWARHDLLSILVEVNREVSHVNAHLDGGIFKQTPAPLVTLRKKLFFR